MGTNEEFYKREEDRKWRELTDERIKNLTTDTTVIQDRLEFIEGVLGELTALIRGNTGSRDEGLNGDVRELQRSINRLQAQMVAIVEKEMGLSQTKTEYHWKFWIAIIGFISTATVAIITNLPSIESYIKREEKPDKLESMIENAKHPKNRYHHYVIRETSQEDN